MKDGPPLTSSEGIPTALKRLCLAEEGALKQNHSNAHRALLEGEALIERTENAYIHECQQALGYLRSAQHEMIHANWYNAGQKVRQARKQLCEASDGSVYPLVHKQSQFTVLPVTDARTNVREVCKNCLLLESHLEDKGKRCPDCCRKHAILIVAYVEEALTLNNLSNEDKNDLLRARDAANFVWCTSGEHSQYPEALQRVRKTNGFLLSKISSLTPWPNHIHV